MTSLDVLLDWLLSDTYLTVNNYTI